MYLGHHLILARIILIMMPFYSTCPTKGTFKTKGQARRYSAAATGAPAFMEVVQLSSVRLMNLLTEKGIADRMAISLVILSQLMLLEKICSRI
jgi:hypothetical protein